MNDVRDLSLPAAPTSVPQASVAGYSLTTIVLGAALGSFLPFVAVVLSARGLSVAEIGFVAALGAAGYVVVVPVLGHLADIRVGRPRMLGLTCLIGGPLMASITLDWSPQMVAILYISGTLFVSAWMPLTDAILVNAFPEGRRYSRWRALLSASYAVSAVIAGVLYATTGFTTALMVVATGGLVLAAIAPRLPDLGLSRHPAVTGEALGGNPLGFLIAGARDAFAIAPVLPQILLAVALVVLGYMAGSVYIGLRMIELGGGAVDVGLAGSLSAAVEIPGIIVAGVVAARLGLRVLFVASGVVLTVIPASWAVLTDVDLILLTRALIGIGFAGMVVSGVLTMRTLLPSGLQGSGQTLFQATLFGFAGFVINVLGGLLYPSVGFQGLFALCAGLAGCGVVVGWVAYGHVTSRPEVEPAP